MCHCSFVFQTQTKLIIDVSGNFHVLIDELERTLYKRRLTLKNEFNWFSLHFVLFQMLVPMVGWKIGSDYNLNSHVHFVSCSYTNFSFAFFFRCPLDMYSSLLSMFIHFTRTKEWCDLCYVYRVWIKKSNQGPSHILQNFRRGRALLSNFQ